MITLQLPEALEKHFWEVVQDSYSGDVQAAVIAFLRLHDKFGWKDQFLEDVTSIRTEVKRQGCIKEKVIEDAIERYRRGSI